MTNVINFDRSLNNRPDDLMSLIDLCAKYSNYTYSYLYKWSVRAKKEGLKHITPYWEGGLVLSEREVLEFDDKKRKLKYGGNQ